MHIEMLFVSCLAKYYSNSCIVVNNSGDISHRCLYKHVKCIGIPYSNCINSNRIYYRNIFKQNKKKKRKKLLSTMTEEERIQYKKEYSKHFEERWWYEPIGGTVIIFILDTILKFFGL